LKISEERQQTSSRKPAVIKSQAPQLLRSFPSPCLPSLL